MTPKRRIVTLVLAAGIAATGLITLAGDLNPPPGAVAPTHKTLTEVQPRIAINLANTPGDADSLFRITAPGSYYLTGNITGVAGKHGIEIAASGVTLDLNGFDLVGVAGMGAFDGVSATVAGLTNIAVVNGSVRSWGGEGVDLVTSGAANGRVEDILASHNAGNGISTGNGGTVIHCSAGFNTGSGIKTSFSCTITLCTAANNTVNGIETATGCTVTQCTAANNAANGISVGTGSTLADCTARLNTIDGILCSSGCFIRGNTCSFNGTNGGIGAGIHVTSIDNRIEGNNCTDADRGIDVDGTGNIIIKNTCSGNSINWDIASGNVFLAVNAMFAAAVNGSAGGVSPGSTDPNANFSY